MKQIWFTLMAWLCACALAAAKPDLSTSRPLPMLELSGGRHVYDSPASPRLCLRLVQPQARDRRSQGLHDLVFCRGLLGRSSSADAHWFTGYLRHDWFEWYLDYAGARYYRRFQGRFTSPDPLGAAAGKEGDPQSWNLYAYARNNPLLYVDPDGLRYRICDTSWNCYDDYTDADFDKNLSGTAQKGVLYDKDGNKIGTYQRTSFDDQSPFGNMFFSQMSARRQVSNQFIGAFAAASVVAGTGVGIGLQATGGASITTLESAASYFRYSPGQLNQLIGGAQRGSLKDLFGQGQQGAASRLANFKLPGGITRETLEIYKEAAVRVVQRGPGSPGFEVQKLRLEIVEKALSMLKK